MALFTEGEENFIRVCMLLINVCRGAVRTKFDFEIAPAKLKRTIQKGYNVLVDLKHKRVVNQVQWNILHPKNVDPSSESFDISLMILLLHHLAGQSISERLPLKTDTSVGADLSRINYYRNKYFHSASIEIDHGEYVTAWNDLCEAIQRLGGRHLQQDCETMKIASLDISHKNLILEIRNAEDEIECLKEDVQKLQHAQSELYRLNPKLRGRQNVLPTEKQITTEKYNELFLETEVILDGQRILEDNGLVILTGKVGTGKSINALEIIRNYCHRHLEYDIQRVPYTFLECNMNIWENEVSFVNPHWPPYVIKGTTKVVLLVDDVLQTDAGLPVSVVIQILEVIQHLVKNGCIKAVCVITELDEITERTEIFGHTSILDLDSCKYKLKNNEKEQLLRTYINAIPPFTDEPCQTVKQLDDETIKDILLIDNNSIPIGFPELCFLFTNVPTLYSCGSDFFRSPCNCILDDLRNLKKTKEKPSKIHYLWFSFLMMEGRLVNQSDIINHIRSTPNKLCGDVKVIEIRDEFEKMKENNAYLRKRLVVIFSSTCPLEMYSFRNAVICNLFVSTYFESDILSSIGLLDIGFITTQLKPYSLPNNVAKPGFVVNRDLFEPLAERIITCLQSKGNAVNKQMHMIACSCLLYDIDFLNILLDKSSTLYMDSDVSISFREQSVDFFLPANLLQLICNKPNGQNLICILIRNIDFFQGQSTLSEKIKEACRKTIVYVLCKRCTWDDTDVLDEVLTVIEKYDIQVDHDDYNCLFLTAFQNMNEKTMKWVIGKFGDRMTSYVNIFVMSNFFKPFKIQRDRFEWLVKVIGKQYFNIYNIMKHLAGNNTNTYADELIYVWQNYEESITRDRSEDQTKIVINDLMKVACDRNANKVVSRLYEYFKDTVVSFDDEMKILELLYI